jgi:Mg2+ and Co2+ transporter CorA
MILLLLGLLIGRCRKESMMCRQLLTGAADQISEFQKG